jgi:cell division protease FtsH
MWWAHRRASQAKSAGTGYALLAANSKQADPVHKITIISHGHAAFGYTMQLPAEDHYPMTQSALLDKLRGQGEFHAP